jgi:hypothetical protein
MPKLPDTAGDTTVLSDIGGQFLPLNYNGETLCLENCFNQLTWVSGWYDAVGYYAGGEQTLRDNGAGTTIVANGAVHLTVLNFQSDPIAKVVLANETRAPILWNDGNGGSVLSTWSGGIIHFVGEVVPASQIVSSVQPVMAFVAPPAPPPPAPAPDPVIIVTGASQVVPLTNAANTTVVDHGTGTLIELFGACQITVQGFGAVTDFATHTTTPGADHTGKLIFEDQGGFAQSVTNDGNGGTLVQVGSASVDFAGVVLDARHQIFGGNGQIFVQSV